jgi:fatty-acid peroxygenase
MSTPPFSFLPVDNSFALWREGYRFLVNRFERTNSDILVARFLGFPVVCIHGDEAAQVFYRPEYFQREHTIPKLLQKSFLGDRSIHTYDNGAHRAYKAHYLSFLTGDSLDRFDQALWQEWKAASLRWEQRRGIAVFWEAQEVLCRAACRWAGVELHDSEAQQRARDLWTMVDAFGALTPLRHVRGIFAHHRLENWLAPQIARAMAQTGQSPAPAILHVIASHHQPGDSPNAVKQATVTLLNVLRPIVAISSYITFCALALHQYHEARSSLLVESRGEGDNADEPYLNAFVQEVRRFYPFTPFLAARVRQPFAWHGYNFAKGQPVLLDVYGTLHNSGLFPDPYVFLPERFLSRPVGKFDLIPQGGGDYLLGHRCPGEMLTVRTMKTVVRILTQHMTYEVPKQTLHFSLSRMPTVPHSRFQITQVKSH